MKKGTLVVWWLLSILILTFRPVYAAEPEEKPPEPAEKPLGPGWLSVDGSVGLLDKAIADGNGRLLDARGNGMRELLDSGYSCIYNHTIHPANVSGRVIDKVS